ncbi:MAG TPA: futalosine synthase, partial [Nitrospirae bacterium]|nr:futalosine synthase [Nitrospirota bacterium]
MKKTKLRVGRIPYANLFPTFNYLERKCDLSDYRFVEGVPSTLNRMLREGKLDISPSSSIEYLKNKKKYFILPWFTISSTGPISSILLFSKLPLKELHNKTVAVTSASETSVLLLKIILNKFLSLKCRFKKIKRTSVKNILSSYPAVLLIGDQAMKQAKLLSAVKKSPVSSIVSRPSRLYIYDLGELWAEHTDLPFVFALWIVRKDAVTKKMELIKKLSADLLKAKKFAPKQLSSIAKQAPQKKWLSEKDLVNYWKKISYD